MKTVGILLFDDVEELDFAGPYEVFAMAGRFGGDCETVTIAAERREIRCRHGLRVVPDHAFASAPALSILIVPGGLGARTHAREDPRILAFVQKQSAIVASVCTGALILAAAGRLRDLTATTHHNSLELLREYADIDVVEGVRFIVHDRVATSAGISAGIDLSLALVAREWGGELAQRVADNMEWQSDSWKEFSIRRAVDDDAAAISECLRDAFAEFESRYTREAYRDTVPDERRMRERLKSMSVFVAVTGAGEVIGTIACGDGHLRGVAVRPPWQGRGVAGLLMDVAEEELRRLQFVRVTLHTTEPLERAMHFYENRGYRATGRVSDFFGMPLYEYRKSLTIM